MLKKLHSFFKPHICGEENHRFKSVYDNKINVQLLALLDRYESWRSSGLDSLKDLNYLGDICKYCGKFVEVKKNGST